MVKRKMGKIEQQTVNVLKYQDERLKSLMRDSRETGTKAEAEIGSLESIIRERGIDPRSIGAEQKATRPQAIIVPKWEELCEEAERAVGNGCKLESLFTSEEIKRNDAYIAQLEDEFNRVHSLDHIDIAISALAGLVGALINILLVGTPQKGKSGLSAAPLENFIREKFEEVFPEEEMEKLANSKSSKVPYDAQDNRNTREYVSGLSAYYHRLLSLGHDPLLGFVVGVFDIITGRMTTIDKDGNVVCQVMEHYADRKETDVFTALVKQWTHLKSDITTSMGLPAPLMSVFNLFQFGSIGEEEQTIAEIVQGMYYEGYDFIHFCAMSIPVMVEEIIVRISYAIKRIKEGYRVRDSIPFSTDREKHPKLKTMLFIAHSSASAINAGQVCFSKNPMAINYPEWIAFAKYMYLQLKWVLAEKEKAREDYVNGKLDEEWMRIEEEANESFRKLCQDNIVIFS